MLLKLPLQDSSLCRWDQSSPSPPSCVWGVGPWGGCPRWGPVMGGGRGGEWLAGRGPALRRGWDGGYGLGASHTGGLGAWAGELCRPWWRWHREAAECSRAALPSLQTCPWGHSPSRVPAGHRCLLWVWLPRRLPAHTESWGCSRQNVPSAARTPCGAPSRLPLCCLSSSCLSYRNGSEEGLVMRPHRRRHWEEMTQQLPSRTGAWLWPGGLPMRPHCPLPLPPQGAGGCPWVASPSELKFTCVKKKTS